VRETGTEGGKQDGLGKHSRLFLEGGRSMGTK
jgi:hypothetical protein